MPLTRRDTDHGQAAVVVVTTTTVLLIVFVLAVASMGRGVLDRTRAHTAADAAALASLDGGRGAAVELARQHDATLLSWARGPGQFEVTVTVRVGVSTATARASNEP